MTVRKVLRAGHPLLRQQARPVSSDELEQSAFKELVEDMLETMRDRSGVGLAAPQAQAGLRVVVYEITANERYPQVEESVGPRILINPSIEQRSPEMATDWEGCLSLPDLRGKVPRHEWIRVECTVPDGSTRSFRVDGFEARVVQHEIDHLNGQLLVDQLESTKSLCFTEEYRRYQADQ